MTMWAVIMEAPGPWSRPEWRFELIRISSADGEADAMRQSKERRAGGLPVAAVARTNISDDVWASLGNYRHYSPWLANVLHTRGIPLDEYHRQFVTGTSPTSTKPQAKPAAEVPPFWWTDFNGRKGTPINPDGAMAAVRAMSSITTKKEN